MIALDDHGRVTIIDLASFTSTVFIGGVFVIAGGVKGMAGLGLPTVAMGLLSLALPASQAASLLLLPSLVTNVWQALAGPALARLTRRLCAMWLGVVAGTLFGILPSLGAGAEAGKGWLGVVLIAYGAWGLLRPPLDLTPAQERWLGPLAGYVTGAITAATGVFVVPAVPYLQALRLSKEELVQGLGLSFTVSTFALAGHLYRAGGLDGSGLSLSAAAVVPALAGLWLGERLRRRMSDRTFRIGFYVALMLLGGAMLMLALRR